MDILIDEKDGSLWTAALQDGRLEGLEVDPYDEQVRWGSVYWAKILSFDPALDAVYLDLDGHNRGLLFNQDVRLEKGGKIIKGGEKPITKLFEAGDFVKVQAKASYRPSSMPDMEREEDKTPRMSMDITMPGRYLVYAPMMQDNRISMRIRDKELRKTLRKMLECLSEFQGVILRASAANTQTDMLVREGKILKEAWEQMSQFFEGSEPCVIMAGPDAIQRTLSDQASQQIDEVELTVMSHYTLAEEWCAIFAPDLVTKIKAMEEGNAAIDFALFDHRDILGQIEDLFHSYVLLPGGGNLIIQNTAALCAIDVNRGGDKRPRLELNIEAAKEVARQIRLRNIGGIVIVDFLKMNNKKDEGQLIAALEEFINDDPCTVQIHGMTALGLIEMTRKRRTPPLADQAAGFMVV